MGFVAPLLFAGLVAVAIPIFIHLIQRERKRVVEFPSLMFLRRIPYQSVRRRRIRDLLWSGSGRHARGGIVGRVHLEGIQKRPAGNQSPADADVRVVRHRPRLDRRSAGRRGQILIFALLSVSRKIRQVLSQKVDELDAKIKI